MRGDIIKKKSVKIEVIVYKEVAPLETHNILAKLSKTTNEHYRP